MAKKIILNIDELTYHVNGAIFEVNNQLGPGFLEKVYENALCIELKDRGLPVKSQVPLKVKYKGYIVGDYYADIVVADTLILELKAVSALTKLHEAQLLNYLRATGIELGWLVNFAHARAEIKRFKLYPMLLCRKASVFLSMFIHACPWQKEKAFKSKKID